MDDKRPPWREPMLWLVVGLPLASIVAGVGLVVVATRTGGDDATADRVQRTGQAQVADLGPDAQARSLALSAIVRIEEDLLEVLPVTGEFRRDEPLRLALRHPTQAASDQVLDLAPHANGWRLAAHVDRGHDWKVQLSDAGGTWRITGRLPQGQRAAHLKPALRQ